MLKQGIWAAILVGLSINGFFVLAQLRRKRTVLQAEKNEHYVAIHPFYIAEQERLFLQHLRRLREEERELMKDHPGWKLGTLYGEPVYKTMPPGTLPHISPLYFSGHRPRGEWYRAFVYPDFYEYDARV